MPRRSVSILIYTFTTINMPPKGHTIEYADTRRIEGESEREAKTIASERERGAMREAPRDRSGGGRTREAEREGGAYAIA